MKVFFFDFVNDFGGKPRLTAGIMRELRGRVDFVATDAYGLCHEYLDLIKQIDIQYKVLCPDAARSSIGSDTSLITRTFASLASASGLVRLLLRLRGEIKRQQPDVLWTSSSKGAFLLLCAGTALPICFHFRRTWGPEWGKGWRTWIMHHPRVRIAVESQKNCDNLTQHGISEKRISVVPNSADVKGIVARSEQPLDKELPRDSRTFKILLPGALVRRKGHLDAINAIPRVLAATDQEATLFLAGGKNIGDTGDYVEQLHKRIGELGIEKHVVFLGQRLDVPRLLIDCNVMILPSYDEGLPLALMESMLLGTPVVTTAVGGILDLVIDGQTGWITDVNRPDMLADKILEALDPVKAAPIVHQAKEHMHAHYTPEHEASAMENAFRDALGNKPKDQ